LAKGNPAGYLMKSEIKGDLHMRLGLLNEESTDYGFFAVYLSADKKNLNLIKEIIFK
jgi:hypothetical protein